MVLVVSTIVEIVTFCVARLASFATQDALFARLAVETVFLFVVPAYIVRRVLRQPLGAFGLTWAGPRSWGMWVAVAACVVLPVAVLATRVPEVHAAYPVLRQARIEPWLLIPSTLAFATYGFAWEFLFRGFLMLGLRARWGGAAILLQAVPCALMHIGKPTLELAASFPGALLFGAIAYRTGSIVPGWLLHVSIAMVMNFACVFWP